MSEKICSVVNILELILASLEMMRLICPVGQVGLFIFQSESVPIEK